MRPKPMWAPTGKRITRWTSSPRGSWKRTHTSLASASVPVAITAEKRPLNTSVHSGPKWSVRLAR